VGDEAWDTFQVSCNEFRSTICKVCTGKNQFGTRMTCRGTHQGMPWAAHGLPWHTPRHVMAAHGWPWHTPRQPMASLGNPRAGHGTHKGLPWHPMAWPWHTPRHAVAGHGLPWHPMGRPWHTPRHFLKKYLEFGRDILHTCLEKSYLQACQVLRFLKKNIFFFNFFN
jgi:hypothetical protein